MSEIFKGALYLSFLLGFASRANITLCRVELSNRLLSFESKTDVKVIEDVFETADSRLRILFDQERALLKNEKHLWMHLVDPDSINSDSVKVSADFKKVKKTLPQTDHGRKDFEREKFLTEAYQRAGVLIQPAVFHFEGLQIEKPFITDGFPLRLVTQGRSNSHVFRHLFLGVASKLNVEDVAQIKKSADELKSRILELQKTVAFNKAAESAGISKVDRNFDETAFEENTFVCFRSGRVSLVLVDP